jgi:hypothetical protein
MIGLVGKRLERPCHAFDSRDGEEMALGPRFRR